MYKLLVLFVLLQLTESVVRQVEDIKKKIPDESICGPEIPPPSPPPIIDQDVIPPPYIFCPSPPLPNQELIYSTNEDSFPDKQCVKCNLMLNDDETAVLVKCYQCQRVSKPPVLIEVDKCVQEVNETITDGNNFTIGNQ